MKRCLTLIASLALMALAGLAQAQLLYQDGRHYTTLENPVPTSDPKRIEVVEVFWYGCPHCYRFEPLAAGWKAKLPADVAFVQVPGIWRPVMELHARAFYAAEALGVSDKVNPAFFRAMNEEGKNLDNEAAVVELFEKSTGLKALDIQKAMTSFTVNSRTKQAEQVIRAYAIQGTPSLVVNGRYVISGRGLEGDESTIHATMLKVADFLVAQERIRLKMPAPAPVASAAPAAETPKAEAPKAEKAAKPAAKPAAKAADKK